ncbi:MAG: PKD domain-containing protein, partial [Gemmatimonadaceae bacterium]
TGVVKSGGTGSPNRLLYTGSEAAPPPPPPPTNSVASFTGSCSGRTCSFNASSSTGATSYSWAFGDGTSATGVTTSHRYARNRTYTVTLTTQPGTSTASKTVTCNSSCTVK